MNDFNKFMKAGFSSNIALLITYPIDIYKINKQMIIKKNNSLRNYYRGILRALPLTFFDKGIKIYTYESTKNKLNQKNFSIEGSIITTFAQSIFITPTDVIKIRNQIKNKNIFLYRGLHLSLARDLPFNIIFFGISDSFDNKYSKFVGSFLATAIVTPIDVVKTRYCENPNNKLSYIIKNMRPIDYFKGFYPRVLSLGIFYGITYNLYLYL